MILGFAPLTQATLAFAIVKNTFYGSPFMDFGHFYIDCHCEPAKRLAVAIQDLSTGWRDQVAPRRLIIPRAVVPRLDRGIQNFSNE